MSIEVELKLKIKNKKELEQKLLELGFSAGDMVSESDTYYTSEYHDFAGLDEALRIRSIENLTTGEKEAVITYKGAKLDKKSMARKELETTVGDAGICREILESIGFSPVPEVEKVRKHFQKDEITACVDSVKNLGDFLELEWIVSEEKEREAALGELGKILKMLGYSMTDTTRKSYLSMLTGGEN